MAEKIKITFLGTGSAIPTSSRNHISVLINYKDQGLLFDCGEGTQRQLKKAKISPSKITKIFISHWHGDHTLGIPGLLQTLIMSRPNGLIEIHGPVGTKIKMKKIIDFHLNSYLNELNEKEEKLEIKSFDHEKGLILDNSDYKISCFPLNHGQNSIAYSFEIKEKSRLNKEKLRKLKLPNSPLLKELLQGKTINYSGKKIDGKKLIYTEPKRKVSYVFDTRYSPKIKDFVKESDILIIESTYLDEEELAYEHGHLTSKQAAKIANDSNSRKLILLHLSQRYDKKSKQIKDNSMKFFKGEILIPEDLDKINL
jgi:ribonuclease Z